MNTRGIKKFVDIQHNIRNLERQLKGGVPAFLTVVVVAILLINGVKLDFDQRGNQFFEEVFPVSAVEWSEDNPLKGNGFNYFPWGGYLLYRLWPENLVFIDGQTDFYGEQLTREYEKIITLADGWQNLFSKYQIEWVLMPADSILISELRGQGPWEIVFEDNTSVIAAMKNDY